MDESRHPDPAGPAGGLSELLRALARFVDSGAEALLRLGAVDAGHARWSYGYSVRWLERRPGAEVADEGDWIAVVVALPGVDPSSLHVDASAHMLVIEAAGPGRSYREAVDLPAAVDPASLGWRFERGVLRVHVRKTAGGPGRPAADVPVDGG
ncbi:MAG: hypothetical protein IRY95_01555 [Clostridia bacterium]|nr:hypothetical protein [Clostridia bacterium]